MNIGQLRPRWHRLAASGIAEPEEKARLAPHSLAATTPAFALSRRPSPGGHPQETLSFSYEQHDRIADTLLTCRSPSPS
jgi:hypothetical protein